jgi:hypothetical protein
MDLTGGGYGGGGGGGGGGYDRGGGWFCVSAQRMIFVIPLNTSWIRRADRGDCVGSLDFVTLFPTQVVGAAAVAAGMVGTTEEEEAAAMEEMTTEEAEEVRQIKNLPPYIDWDRGGSFKMPAPVFHSSAAACAWERLAFFRTH